MFTRFRRWSRTIGGGWRRGLTMPAAAGALLLVAAPPAAATVPEPTDTTAVVTVKVGGDRTGTTAVGPLAGVELGLFATEDASTPVDDDWGRCVSDGDGDCSFVVPDTEPGGDNRDRQFVVKGIDAPAGWYANPTLRTGPGRGSGSSPHQFQTPPVQATNTYRSTSDFVVSTSNSLPASCGLDVALLLDLSASVGSDLPNLKDAADTFADALVGTQSRMAAFSFSATSPSLDADANHPELLPVSTQAGADAFKAQYADWQISAGTNRDQGLVQVALAEQDYDALVVITDGNSTRDGADPVQGDGSRTHFRGVEAGAFSAKAVKAQDTRVIAENFQTPDYSQTGQELHELALDECAGSLTVVKQIVPADTTGEDVTGAEPAGEGWTFAGSTTTPGIGGLPATGTTTGDGTGSVVYELDYPAGTTEADVTVTEQQQPGYSLVTPGGQNAVCENLDDGSPVPVDNTGDAANPGFTVEVPAGDAVSCQVYDRAPRPAEVTVDKRWTIDGVDYDHGDQPDGFGAALTLTGPGDAGPTPQDFGVARDGYQVGDTTTLAETVTLADPTCRLDRARVTSVNGRPANLPLPYTATVEQPENTYAVTNTVTCKPVTPTPSPSRSHQPYAVVGGGPQPEPSTALMAMTDSPGTAVAVGGLLGLGGAVLLVAMTRRRRDR